MCLWRWLHNPIPTKLPRNCSQTARKLLGIHQWNYPSSPTVCCLDDQCITGNIQQNGRTFTRFRHSYLGFSAHYYDYVPCWNSQTLSIDHHIEPEES